VRPHRKRVCRAAAYLAREGEEEEAGGCMGSRERQRNLGTRKRWRKRNGRRGPYAELGRAQVSDVSNNIFMLRSLSLSLKLNQLALAAL